MGLFYVLFVVIEFIADQQQYDFQTEKYERISKNKALGIYEDGFVSTGLWAFMRHPNYAAEQSIWIILYFFTR